jgi:tyrosine phenol-lyase
LSAQHGILLMLDATRALENAYFIQQREAGYHDHSVSEILRELCEHSDGATVSSKKDNLVNIGGFLALRDPDLATRARALLVAFEGLHTYGGMSGRDMEALARGIREMVATAAESVVDLYAQRETIGGLHFTYEPRDLRFFQARFSPLPA